MELGDLIARDGVLPSLRSKTKKLALQELANRSADMLDLSPRTMFDALVQRENLGSTGLGRGIAIPHVKLPGVRRIMCLFARLETPIEFDAVDGEPVDLVFLLIGPEHASGDHLKALARISRNVRDPRVLERLRAAKDAAALYAILSEPVASHAA